MIPQRSIEPTHLTISGHKNYGDEYLCIAGGTISAMDIVCPNGTTAGHVQVVQADTDATATSRTVLLVAMHAATTGQQVRCSTKTVTTLNTAASAVSAPVYLSSVAGGITLTLPATGGVIVGRVLSVGATGYVLLSPGSDAGASAGGGGTGGTDSLTFTVNQDGAAATDEDPALILEGGDGGAELIQSRFQQDSSADLVFFETRIPAGAWKTSNLHIGNAAQTTADMDAFVTFNATTGAAAAAQAQLRWLGQEGRFDLMTPTNFAGIRFDGTNVPTAVFDYSALATGEADYILGANLASAVAWRVAAVDVLSLDTTTDAWAADLDALLDVDYTTVAAASLLDLNLTFNHASNLFTGLFINNTHGAANRDAGSIVNGSYVLIDSVGTDNAAAIYRAYCAETDGSGGVHEVLHHGAGFDYTIDSAAALTGENRWGIPTNVADAWTLYDATAVLPVARVVSTTGDLHFSVYDGLDTTERRVGGRIYERIADSAALVGVNGGGADAETVIDTVTIPASAIKAGSRIDFKVTARITVGATAGTLIMAVRLGGVAGQIVAQIAAADPGAAGSLWEAEGSIIGRAAPAAAASCVHRGKCASAFFASGAAPASELSFSTIANQATNGALTLVVTGIWNSATNDAVVVQDFSVDAVG